MLPLHNHRFGTIPARAQGYSGGKHQPAPLCKAASQGRLGSGRQGRAAIQISQLFLSRSHQISLYIAFLQKLLPGGVFFHPQPFSSLRLFWVPLHSNVLGSRCFISHPWCSKCSGAVQGKEAAKKGRLPRLYSSTSGRAHPQPPIAHQHSIPGFPCVLTMHLSEELQLYRSFSF